MGVIHKVQVVITQRLLMPYRLSVFEKLPTSERNVTVLFADAPHVHLEMNIKARYKQLKSLTIRFAIGSKTYMLPFYPHVVFWIVRHRPDVIIMEGSTNLLNNIFILIAGRVIGSGIIWWDAGRRVGVKPNLLRRLSDPLINWFMRHSDACLAYSNEARKYMICQNVSEEAIRVAYNTIDTDVINKRIEQNLKLVDPVKDRLQLHDKDVIVFVGTIEKRKRLEDLIVVFEKLQNQSDRYVLLIIGDGPDLPRMKRLVETKGLQRIFFLGRKVEDLGAYLLASDVFALPSEGGLAMVEAMGHGLPVVATSADGTELDLIENGKNGFIVSEGNTDEFASAVKKILADPAMKASFSKAARAKVEGIFSISQFVSTISETIDFVVRKKGAPVRQ